MDKLSTTNKACTQTTTPAAAASPVAASVTEVGKSVGDGGFYDAYAVFSRSLRGWLVAYGIGGPVLFATQSTLSDRLAKSDVAHLVIGLFLAGVGVQICATLIYKTAMWYMYAGELDEEFRHTRRYLISEWLTDQFWLEISFDLAAISLFGAATIWTMTILT